MQSFLCKLYHDHGWPAAALQTPCRNARLLGLGVILKFASLHITPLKKIPSLDFSG